jgi:hypothetical protein
VSAAGMGPVQSKLLQSKLLQSKLLQLQSKLSARKPPARPPTRPPYHPSQVRSGRAVSPRPQRSGPTRKSSLRLAAHPRIKPAADRRALPVPPPGGRRCRRRRQAAASKACGAATLSLTNRRFAAFDSEAPTDVDVRGGSGRSGPRRRVAPGDSDGPRTGRGPPDPAGPSKRASPARLAAHAAMQSRPALPFGDIAAMAFRVGDHDVQRWRPLAWALQDQ